MDKIKVLMDQLGQCITARDELEAVIDGIKDQIKEYMQANDLDTIYGDGHKATYKPVDTTRLDGAAVKHDLPDVYRAYARTTTSKRFVFK